jgi:hypothetical protein
MVHGGLILIDTNGLRRDPDPFGMVHDGLMLIRLAVLGMVHGGLILIDTSGLRRDPDPLASVNYFLHQQTGLRFDPDPLG